MKPFNEHLRSIRKHIRLTQRAVAEGIGITERGYQKIESGERIPSMPTLTALAEFFDVPIDYLAGRGLFATVDKIEKNWDLLISDIIITLQVSGKNELAEIMRSGVFDSMDIIRRIQMLEALFGDIEISNSEPPTITIRKWTDT